MSSDRVAVPDVSQQIEANVATVINAPNANTGWVRIKLFTVGDPNVGKSCLVKRFCESKFVTDYIATIGIDYGIKTSTINGMNVKIDFWDSAGDDIYLQVRNEFYSDTQGVVFVYNASSEESLGSLEKWYRELEKYACKDVSGIKGVVLANKSDQVGDAQALIERGETWAKEKGFMFAKTSAATGEGVHGAFTRLIELLLPKSQ